MARGKNEIRHTGDLPDWFRLDKYDAAAVMDAAGWYEQIYARSQCFLMLKNAGWSKSIETEKIFLYDCDSLAFSEVKALREVRKNPIVDTVKNIELRPHFLSGLCAESAFKNEKPFYSMGVHSMTVRELRLHERTMAPGRLEYSRRWRDQFRSRTIASLKYPHKEWIDRPIYESGKHPEFYPNNSSYRLVGGRMRAAEQPVVVNLNLPDALLIESFREWLKFARPKTKDTAAARRYRKPDFDSWVRLGILPFLDLTIWAIEAGVSIPNRVMADAIFHPGEGGEEVVRKTTEPTALKLVGERDSEGMAPLDALRAQAALELAGQFDAKAEESDT